MKTYGCYPFMKREFGSVKAEDTSIASSEVLDSFSHIPVFRLTRGAMYPVATRGQQRPMQRKWGAGHQHEEFPPLL